MTGVRRLLVLAIVVCGAWSAGPAALAWKPETRVAMIDQALRLLPASLSAALGAHREALVHAALSPLTEDGADRRPPWAGGHLDRALADSVHALAGHLSRPTPFDRIAGRFGLVAHFVMEAGFPPGMSRVDGDARYAHFAEFCESRRERFPLVFHGHADPALDRDDYLGFARRIMTEAGADDEELSRAYAAAGEPPHPEAFDDRSVPFAVGSLNYSRTINAIVRLWLSVWERAGGDMGRTPYMPETKHSNGDG